MQRGRANSVKERKLQIELTQLEAEFQHWKMLNVLNWVLGTKQGYKLSVSFGTAGRKNRIKSVPGEMRASRAKSGQPRGSALPFARGENDELAGTQGSDHDGEDEIVILPAHKTQTQKVSSES